MVRALPTQRPMLRATRELVRAQHHQRQTGDQQDLGKADIEHRERSFRRAGRPGA
jgi:hypothetical protein